MKRRGFSIIELAVVIALIGILSLLLFASLRNSQVSARDDERHAKAELIARSLEMLYKTGNPTQGYQPGVYPGMTTIKQRSDNGTLHELLPSIDSSTVKLSWLDGSSNIRVLKNNSSLNHNYTERGTYETNDVGQDEFVYSSYQDYTLAADADKWRFCPNDQCRRFNLYYRTEADNVVHTIRSSHQ